MPALTVNGRVDWPDVMIQGGWDGAATMILTGGGRHHGQTHQIPLMFCMQIPVHLKGDKTLTGVLTDREPVCGLA